MYKGAQMSNVIFGVTEAAIQIFIRCSYTIALYTKLDAMCDQQATVVGECREHLATSAVVARCCHQQADARCLFISRSATPDMPWPIFLLSPNLRTKFQREVSLFFEIP